MSEIGIGSTVWYFDVNRRTYRRESGRAVGGPIWREHWGENAVTGETSRSWILSHGWHTNPSGRIPKKRVDFTRLAYSQDEIEEIRWVEEHRHYIGRKVHSLTDAAILKQVAELVGYEPEGGK